MRKCDELADPKSCLNKARAEEWIFVLLARDAAAPAAVRAWVEARVRLGLNEPGDPRLVEAEGWAREAEAESGAKG